MKQYPKSFSDWKNNSGVVLCLLTLLDFKITNIATPFIIEPKMKHSMAAMKPILEANTGMTMSGSLFIPSFVVFLVSFAMCLLVWHKMRNWLHFHIQTSNQGNLHNCRTYHKFLHFLSLHLVRIRWEIELSFTWQVKESTLRSLL